jgi:hypothetical protein
MRPLSTHTQSVNVPPVSTATRNFWEERVMKRLGYHFTKNKGDPEQNAST